MHVGYEWNILFSANRMQSSYYQWGHLCVIPETPSDYTEHLLNTLSLGSPRKVEVINSSVTRSRSYVSHQLPKLLPLSEFI